MTREQDWLLVEWQALADGYKQMTERGEEVPLRTEIVASPEFIAWMNSLDKFGRMMLMVAVNYAYNQGFSDGDDVVSDQEATP